jgi:hypothetical protein
MRRRAASVLAIVLVLTLAIEPLRSLVFDVTPLPLRHVAIAAWTSLAPPIEDTADLAPIAHVGGNPYGINVFREQEVEESKVRRSLEMIRAAGFGWIKQQVVWGEVEVPTKGQFVDRATGGESWRKYDRIVDLAGEYGLDVILRVDTSPAWARPGQPKLETPPERYEDYADFIGRLAERYQGRVRYYQIWNEPNVPFEWGDRPPDPVAYTRLLWLASQRVHAVDPGAAVISAAMAPTTEFSEHGINELRYLQAMYDAGARGSFDILGANAYGLRSGPHDRRLALGSDVNFSRTILVRRLMVRNGDAGRPIWAAEVGWNAVPDGSGIPDLWGRVDRQTQAAYTASAFARAQREWPWMGVMNLWHFRLVGANAHRLPQYYFNAVDDEFGPLPLYEAMRELTHRPRAMQRGYRQEDDWNLAYSGGWLARRSPEAVLGGYRQAAGAASFRLAFEGTDIALVVDRLPGGGVLEARVDGLPSVALSLDAPREEWGVRAPVASGLADGWHILEVRTRDDRPVRLDGLIVDRRERWPGLTPDTLLLALGLLVGLLTVGRALAGRLAECPAGRAQAGHPTDAARGAEGR